jgi:hypothetical protein
MAAIPPAEPNAQDQVTRRQATVTELAVAKRDMVEAISRNIADLVAAYEGSSEPLSVAEASTRLRQPAPPQSGPTEPDQVSWHELGNLIEHEPARAVTVYEEIKAAARAELQTGTRVARTLEGVGSIPYARAQFLAILDALRISYEPQNPAEVLLVQEMAACLEQHLRWQKCVTERTDQEAFMAVRDRRRLIESMSLRERERYELEHGYMPPRVSDIEAVDQAVLNADRYLRMFLRLGRTLRDMRRVLGTVIVHGGQLNLAERQTVIQSGEPQN